MKIIKAFPTWNNPLSGGGVFKSLASVLGTEDEFEWLGNFALLDVEYFGNHSGSKESSPLLDKFIEDTDGNLTPSQKSTLAGIIGMTYRDKWSRLYNVKKSEYNPIENYKMTETETPNITKTHNPTGYRTEDTTSQKQDITVSSTAGASSNVFGFNSQEPVPNATSDGTNTMTTRGSDTDNVVKNTHTENGTITDTETGNRVLERSGNIGVTTSQQMIQSEIDLWKWDFFETVYADVDAVLTVPLY